MPDYHEYHVDVTDENGNARTETVHVHEDHHNDHGFDGSGALKNAAALTTIIAGALAIGPHLVKGFKYFGKVIRK
jgi:hypothetical protein